MLKQGMFPAYAVLDIPTMCGGLPSPICRLLVSQLLNKHKPASLHKLQYRNAYSFYK